MASSGPGSEARVSAAQVALDDAQAASTADFNVVRHGEETEADGVVTATAGAAMEAGSLMAMRMAHTSLSASALSTTRRLLSGSLRTLAAI